MFQFKKVLFIKLLKQLLGEEGLVQQVLCSHRLSVFEPETKIQSDFCLRLTFFVLKSSTFYGVYFPPALIFRCYISLKDL